MKKFSGRHFKTFIYLFIYLLLFFTKLDLTFWMNCLHRSHFAGNVNTYFGEKKNKKCHQFVAIIIIIIIFTKLDLTFWMNCLHRSHFAGNVNTYFGEKNKIKKCHQFVAIIIIFFFFILFYLFIYLFFFFFFYKIGFDILDELSAQTLLCRVCKHLFWRKKNVINLSQ